MDISTITCSWQNLVLYSILMASIGGGLVGYAVFALDRSIIRVSNSVRTLTNSNH